MHVLLGASACYNCYELEPGARQSKAYTLLHVMYVTYSLYTRRTMAAETLLYFGSPLLSSVLLSTITPGSLSRAKDEIRSSHGNNNVNPSE